MSFYTTAGQQSHGGQGTYQQQGMSDFSFPQGTMSGNYSGSSSASYAYGGGASGAGRDEQLPSGILQAFSTSGYSYEPPLLEELGINFHDILQNTKAAILFKSANSGTHGTIDLAGPLFFVLVYGLFLLLSGKLHFGYIYGVGLFGTITLHFLLKLMSNQPLNLPFLQTASILGYSFLPLCILSGCGVIFSLNNKMGVLISFLFVAWCTSSSSGEFTNVLQLHNTRALIAYPLFIFYTVFATMAVFV
ncbi:hypothetical protein ACO0QE_001736 [Hanseniaspora vineae]